MTRLAGLLLLLFQLMTADAGCTSGRPSCETRQQLRRFSLDSIKEQILVRLGMEKAPNITGRLLPSVPPLDQYIEKMQADQPIVEDQDEVELTVEKVFAFAQPHPKMRHWRGKELLWFRFSEKMLASQVVKAGLWVYARPASMDEDPQTLLIEVFSLTNSEPPALVHGPSKKETRPRGGRGRWINIDVKRLVTEWFKSPADMMALALHVTAHGKEGSVSNQRLIITNTSPEANSYVPFLELHTSEMSKHREKRTIGLNCPENSEETRCCRYPLTVDFEEFGWDWIIAPKKYEANYCSGECPFVFLPQYPHTHIVQIANPSGTSGPCCAPRKMSSISMLYFDQSFNVIYGLLPGMVVDRCGCS